MSLTTAIEPSAAVAGRHVGPVAFVAAFRESMLSSGSSLKIASSTQFRPQVSANSRRLPQHWAGYKGTSAHLRL